MPVRCRGEAQALLDDSEVTVAEAAKRLAEECGMVAITAGSRGSCLCTLGRLLVRALEATLRERIMRHQTLL